MKVKILLTAMAVLIAACGAKSPPDQPTIEVWKSPTCNCCSKWIEYLRQEGFNVVAHNETAMNPLKTKLGVPQSLASCHTGVVEGYVIEGHVPAGDIRKLLANKPGRTRPRGPWHAHRIARHGTGRAPRRLRDRAVHRRRQHADLCRTRRPQADCVGAAVTHVPAQPLPSRTAILAPSTKAHDLTSHRRTFPPACCCRPVHRSDRSRKPTPTRTALSSREEAAPSEDLASLFTSADDDRDGVLNEEEYELARRVILGSRETPRRTPSTHGSGGGAGGHSH